MVVNVPSSPSTSTPLHSQKNRIPICKGNRRELERSLSFVLFLRSLKKQRAMAQVSVLCVSVSPPGGQDVILLHITLYTGQRVCEVYILEDTGMTYTWML